MTTTGRTMQSRRFERARWVGIRAGAAALAWLAGPAAARPQDTDAGRVFSLSQTREAAELVRRVEQHLGSEERRSLAFADLERLLERHRGDVLAPEADARHTHAGAAEWARRELFALSPAALAAYADAVGAEAAAALRAARERSDPGALLEVVRRWPVAPAAWRAWIALGDLELERGHPEEASLAWRRARELADLLGEDHAAAFAARTAALERLAAGTARPDASWRLPGPDEGNGVLPRAEHERFAVPLPEGPFSGNAIVSDGFNLMPVLWGEQVFVCTSLRVLAVNAYDGRVEWISEEPAGWERLQRSTREDYFLGVDTASAVIAPAVGSGVVVAPLQVPRFALDNDDFQGIVITVRLPERRLFAFDAATGAPLWNHAPPRIDDLERRPWPERMHVAGSPVIAGPRVLVPLVRMQGRVELHLGCFDLASGELAWSTNVVSGQRELNMFNRHEREFVAPPVRVEGDRVLMVTQLGTVAAFDLFTGHVLWQTAYEQIPLPTTRGWSPTERRRVWKNAPPVVADGVVLATPIDSEDLVALDLATGDLLWSMPRQRLTPRRASDHEVDVLLGAREDAVLLGGAWISAHRKPGGLRQRTAGVAALPEFELGRLVESSLDRRPRALATANAVLVPTRGELLVVPNDADRPDPTRSLPLDGAERGNLAIGDGGLYLVNGRWLHGLLDLGQLEERARERLRAAPDDVEALLALTRLAVRRASSLAGTGDALAAAARLAEARAPLVERLARGGPRTLATELADLARREARLLAEAGRGEAARALLVEVLELANAGRDRIQLLLELHPLLLEVDRDGWLALLDSLDAEGASFEIPETTLAQLDPLWTRFALADAPVALRPVPVALWTAVQRALDAERRGAFDAAFEHWHAALALCGDRMLSEGVSARHRVTELIGALLEVAGDAWYAPFEERARVALAEAQRQRDRRALERLVEAYPFAAAADEARHALVELAYERGDLRALIAAVLPPGRARATPDEAAAQRLVLLALGLGRAGNVEFERGLLRALAASHPSLVVEREPYAGRPLSDWLPFVPDRVFPPAWQRAKLDSSIQSVARTASARKVLGPLPEGAPAAESPSPPAWIVAYDGGIEAFAADGDEDPLWTAPLERPLPDGGARGGWQLFPTRIAVQQGDGVLGLDAATGTAVWRWQPEAAQLLDLASASGVLLARTWQPEAGFGAVGIEPLTGTLLWSAVLPRDRKWLAPIAGEGHAVYASDGFAVDTRLVVLDVFRGVSLGQFDCDENLGPRIPGWIQDGKLLLPSFQSQRLIAFDLAAREVSWALRLADGLDLYALLAYEGDNYLVATPRDARSGRGGELVAVDLALGGTRTVHPLGPDDRLLGIDRAARHVLSAPFVFAATLSTGSVGTPVSAIHLPSGRRWVHRLPVAPEELYEGRWPAPAVSSELVVVPYATRDAQSRRTRAMNLMMLDLSSGVRRDGRVLAPAFARSDEFELFAVGDALWLTASGSRGRDARMEIWRVK